MTTITSPVSDNFGLLPVGGYDPRFDAEPAEHGDPYLAVLDDEMAIAEGDSSEAAYDEHLRAVEDDLNMLADADIPAMVRDLDRAVRQAREV